MVCVGASQDSWWDGSEGFLCQGGWGGMQSAGQGHSCATDCGPQCGWYGSVAGIMVVIRGSKGGDSVVMWCASGQLAFLAEPRHLGW